MSHKKAYLDTSVLTDILLKQTKGKYAMAGLSRFDETLLPVYAIKEFKNGPLMYYKWLYNKLASTDSFADTLEAIKAISTTPKRNFRLTTQEALAEAAAGTLKKVTNSSLIQKYGAKANVDHTLCDIFRLSIKTTIFKAWKRRRRVTTSVVGELSCYTESDPFEKKGLIQFDHTLCRPTKECCLGPDL